MPKPYQGVAVAESIKRIELSYLFKRRLIRKGHECSSTLHWNRNNQSTGSVAINSCLNEEEKWIELIYTYTDNYSGRKCDEQYKIYLETIPSNLGIGEVYYFICPSTGHLCRILYLAYGSNKFKSRFAYRYPIYYQSQVCSKSDYWNTRYFKALDELEKMKKSKINETYKGKVTRSNQRLNHKELQVLIYDRKRWGILAGILEKWGI